MFHGFGTNCNDANEIGFGRKRDGASHRSYSGSRCGIVEGCASDI